MKNKAIWVTVLIIIIVVAIKILFYSEPIKVKESGRRVEKEVPVDVMVTKGSNFSRKIITNGSVLALEEVELRPEISGRITQILFKEGEFCKKGKLLIKINDAELQAQLQKAIARKKIYEDREYRQRILLEKKGATQETYDAALNDLQAAESDIQLVKAQIEKTEIRAPFDGVIGLRYVSEGSFITASSKLALFHVIDNVKIDFSIPGKYFSHIKTNDKITFTIPGNSEKFIGTVSAIEQKIDPETRTVSIRALAKNSNRKIPAGSFASVEININENIETFSIPTDAVISDVKGQIVYVKKNNKAIPHYIDILDRDVEFVRITSGINIGDSVIISSIIRLRPGMSVKTLKTL